MHKLRLKKTAARGLTLSQGPDPRSHSEAGDMNFAMRNIFMGAIGTPDE